MKTKNAEYQKKSRDKKRDPTKRELRRWVKKSNFDKCKEAIDKIEAEQ